MSSATTSIYLDHNSTTPVHPRVAQAMLQCQLSVPGNPSSQHQLGQSARHRLDGAREVIAGALGIPCSGPTAARIVLTSGGTESNNLALFGLVGRQPAELVVSAIEHPSVLAAADRLQQLGHRVHRLPVDEDGVVRGERLGPLLDSGPVRLVSVMMVNNETGVIQPVEEIAHLCRQRGVLMHCDAAQAVGKLPVDFERLQFDAMSFAAHKFHGPRGVGALVLRHGVGLQPLFYGGTQQSALRPGSEDVALAVGCAEALSWWREEAGQRPARLGRLRDQLEQWLLAAIPGLVVIGRNAPRAPHTSNISLPGADRQTVLLAADLAGVAIATGSACTSGSSEPSAVLQAMGLDPQLLDGAVRISLGATTTEEEIRLAADRLIDVFRRLVSQSR